MKNSIKKHSRAYMTFMLSFNLFIPSALAADGNFQTMYAGFENYINYVNISVLKEYLYKNQNIVIVVIGVIVILLLFFLRHIFKAKRLKLVRKKQAELEELLSYLCLTYDEVKKIDTDNHEVTSYTLVNGEVLIKKDEFKDIDSLEENFHPDDVAGLEKTTIKNTVDRVMKTCTQEEIIVRERKADGEYQWMAYLFQGVHCDKQYHRNCLLLKRNINDLKSKELEQREKLQNALSAAQRSAEAKGNFLSHMSHEIRTPLNAIIGYLSLAKEEPSSEVLNNFLCKSDISAKHLLNVVNDVLDMAAIESGKMKVNNALFDFKQTITVIGNIFYEQAREKGIDFEVFLVDVEEEFVIGDRLRLNQILVNLLSNAVKFTAKGGKVNCLVQQMAIRNKKVFMHFEIIDTGKGMGQEYMKKIFTPFEQESSEIAASYGGSGLGLSITKNLVQMLNGVITVESEEGKGSTFKVDIPFEFDSEHHKTIAPARDFSFVKVLIVDDQENSAKYIEKLLNKFGVATVTANSGSKALEHIEAAIAEGHPFHMCILDWQMPDMDGLETAKKIIELKISAMKVVIATGYDYSKIMDEAKKVGVFRFLNKPVFTSNVSELLVECFGNQALKTELEAPSFDFDGRHILLAEDNDINADVVTRILEKANFKVERAINGQVACEMFGKSEAGYYSAILMDVQMSEINGCEATRLIRMSDHAVGKSIPIVAMTADDSSEDVSKVLSCGMDGHICKPIDRIKLYSTLEDLIK
jgi:two-component system, sensor histidine kinase and response regulator